MKIAIVSAWHDLNRGDSGILLATIQSIRRLLPESQFILVSLFPQVDRRFKNAHCYIKESFPDIQIYGSPLPGSDEPSIKTGYLEWRGSFFRKIWWIIQVVPSIFTLLVPSATAILARKSQDTIRALENADVVVSLGAICFVRRRG